MVYHDDDDDDDGDDDDDDDDGTFQAARSNFEKGSTRNSVQILLKPT